MICLSQTSDKAAFVDNLIFSRFENHGNMYILMKENVELV